jgi:hypothetical protein
MQDRALYSIQEARKLLGGISRNTIYHLVVKGQPSDSRKRYAAGIGRIRD